MKYSVAIVDDHTLLSQAISDLVKTFNNFNPLYICKNGKELIKKLESSEKHPEIILMDVNMPILNGIETTSYLTEHYPTIKVLALSIEENENTILAMIRAGAKGYLLKDIEKHILEDALNQVISKGYYHTNTVTKLLVDALHHKTKTNNLTERELEFIKLACTEKTYKEIAKIMFLSPKTIDGYRDSIYDKLNLKNRIGLVLYAIRHNIFTP